jgi:cytosine deaminase
MDALEAAGRLSASEYKKSTIYTTLSPCPMCTGAILLYKIPRVVIGENETFMGKENLLQDNGVEVIVLNNEECKELMKEFKRKYPKEWAEDIGE